GSRELDAYGRRALPLLRHISSGCLYGLVEHPQVILQQEVNYFTERIRHRVSFLALLLDAFRTLINKAAPSHPPPPVLRPAPRWSRLLDCFPLPGVHVPCPYVGSVETVIFCRGTHRKWLIAGYYDVRVETVCEVHGRVEKVTPAAYLVRLGTQVEEHRWVVRGSSRGLMVLSALEGKGL
ncbi:hypothetical protein LTS18_014074, partial [Coniosporium uncinatum]